jgi:hypothetical protein
MRRLGLILLLSAGLATSLAAKELSDVYSDYSEDFTAPQMAVDGVLSVQATPAFEALTVREQEAQTTAFLKEVSGSLQDYEGPVLLEVHGPMGQTLWSLPQDATLPVSLEHWDPLSSQGRPAGPWFVYFGVGALLDSSEYDTNFQFQFGCYLYKRVFDMALGLNCSMDVPLAEGADSLTFGGGMNLSGRYHFPLGNQGLFGGMVGLQLGVNGTADVSTAVSASSSAPTTTSTSTSTVGALLGLSYFFKGGSLDLTMLENDNSSPLFTIGVTYLFEVAPGAFSSPMDPQSKRPMSKGAAPAASAGQDQP